MLVFHNIECAALRGATCDCMNRTEYEPPSHYTGVDGHDILMYDEKSGRYLDVYDLMMLLYHQWYPGMKVRPMHVDQEKAINRRVCDILQETQAEFPLRPFVEGEQIGCCGNIAIPRERLIFGLPRAEYNTMMEQVWADHQKLTEKQRRCAYTIKRKVLKVQFTLTWTPEYQSFYVRRDKW